MGPFPAAFTFVHRQGEGVARLDDDALGIGKIAEADLRAFGVEERCDGQLQLVPEPTHLLQPHQMVVVGAVAEIEAGHVHACQHDVPKDLLVIRGRAQSADDLCLSHGDSSRFLRLVSDYIYIETGENVKRKQVPEGI